MSLPNFLSALQENGRVKVSIVPDKAPDSAAKIDVRLREMDGVARSELAGTAPEFRIEAARWAAKMLYQGCQFLVFREVNADTVRQALAEACPEKPSPSVCYSVDITLRYLPDLIALSRGLSNDDPLVGGLLTLARVWPLSSVGVKFGAGGQATTDVFDISAFSGDASLRRLYADRIIASGDNSRLNDPLIQEAVREGIGAYDDKWGRGLSIVHS